MKAAALFRTGETELTDDELVLFDALFDNFCTENSLKQEKFSSRFNFAYEHSLSDKQLKVTIENLYLKKLIKFRQVILAKNKLNI